MNQSTRSISFVIYPIKLTRMIDFDPMHNLKKDTLWIMGLTNEFEEGRKWVQESFKFNSKTDVSVFETVIRFVGGFIAGTLLYSCHSITIQWLARGVLLPDGHFARISNRAVKIPRVVVHDYRESANHFNRFTLVTVYSWNNVWR